MTYSAPAGNAADFQFTGVAYSAPAGNAVNFNFDGGATGVFAIAGGSSVTLAADAVQVSSAFSAATQTTLNLTGDSLQVSGSFAATGVSLAEFVGNAPVVAGPFVSTGSCACSFVGSALTFQQVRLNCRGRSTAVFVSPGYVDLRLRARSRSILRLKMDTV